jgi:hypothetical protein
MKHTPGPWEVYIYNPQNLDISKHYIAVVKQKEIFDSSIDVICMFTEINEQTIFICRLIAAAPEMRNELIDSYKRSGLHQNIIERATGLKIEEVLKIHEEHN